MECVCFLARVVIFFSGELEGMSKILRNPKEDNIFSPLRSFWKTSKQFVHN
jgi:hypothetical protein